MRNTRLTKLLKCLTQEEFIQLKKAFQSPIFTQGNENINLYYLLLKYFPNFESDDLNNEAIYEHVFPSEEYSYGRLRTFYSRFADTVEEFLIFNELQKDQFEKDRLLARAFSRGEYDDYKKQVQKTFKDLDGKSTKNIDYFRKKFLLSWDLFYHYQTPKYKEDTIHLSSIDKWLDLFFMFAKVRVSADLLTRKGVLNEKHPFRFLSEIEKHIKGKLGDEFPNLKSYSLVLKLKHSGRGEDFIIAKDLLYANETLFEFPEKQFILIQLLNFVVQA